VMVLCHGEGALTTRHEPNEVLLVELSAAVRPVNNREQSDAAAVRICRRFGSVTGDSHSTGSRQPPVNSNGERKLDALNVPAAVVAISSPSPGILVADRENNRVVQFDGTSSRKDRKSRVVFETASSEATTTERLVTDVTIIDILFNSCLRGYVCILRTVCLR
jgi:hypothetical protein